jgi:hypothetical protein
MNNGLEDVWKEAVVRSFEVLSWPLPGITEDSHRASQSGKPVT